MAKTHTTQQKSKHTTNLHTTTIPKPKTKIWRKTPNKPPLSIHADLCCDWSCHYCRTPTNHHYQSMLIFVVIKVATATDFFSVLLAREISQLPIYPSTLLSGISRFSTLIWFSFGSLEEEEEKEKEKKTNPHEVVSLVLLSSTSYTAPC